jgi:hypothetical protein
MHLGRERFFSEDIVKAGPALASRGAFVYVGGMSAIRSLGRLGSTVCVGCAVFLLWSGAGFGRASVGLAGLVCAAALALAVGSRLLALRSVVVTRDGWMLISLLGRAEYMAPLADVYEQNEDVVALGLDGRTTLLGVDRLPFRKRSAARHSLVEALRRSTQFG